MPRRRSGAERLRSALLWWTGIALAVLIWHTAARTQPEYVLPGPRSTWEALVGLVRDEELGAALLLTVERGAVGLGISCLIGLPLGWAMGTWPWLRELLDSWVQVLMSVIRGRPAARARQEAAAEAGRGFGRPVGAPALGA